MRRYYRFRAARFYGGIATADCAGCNLRCLFCWSWEKVSHPSRWGKMYTAGEVAERLMEIARRAGTTRLRVSGGEPTICPEHLLELLENVQKTYLFILETNGILLDKDLTSSLASFPNLHVRVSIKGCKPETFSRLTGASPRLFSRQIRAVENLADADVSHHVSIVHQFDQREDLQTLVEELASIDPAEAANLELEQIEPYPAVVDRLRRSGFHL